MNKILPHIKYHISRTIQNVQGITYNEQREYMSLMLTKYFFYSFGRHYEACFWRHVVYCTLLSSYISLIYFVLCTSNEMLNADKRNN